MNHEQADWKSRSSLADTEGNLNNAERLSLQATNEFRKISTPKEDSGKAAVILAAGENLAPWTKEEKNSGMLDWLTKPAEWTKDPINQGLVDRLKQKT